MVGGVGAQRAGIREPRCTASIIPTSALAHRALNRGATHTANPLSHRALLTTSQSDYIATLPKHLR